MISSAESASRGVQAPSPNNVLHFGGQIKEQLAHVAARLPGEQRASDIAGGSLLQDLRLPREILKTLADRLSGLNWVVEEAQVWARWKREETRPVSMLSREQERRYLVHIPTEILRDESTPNLMAVSYLSALFGAGDNLYVFSRSLDNYPLISFKDMVDSWSNSSGLVAKFVPWSWFSRDLDDNQSDLATLVRLLDLNPAPVVLTVIPGGKDLPSSGNIDTDLKYLSTLLGALARSEVFIGTKQFFSSLASNLHLPDKWALGDIWSGQPNEDATKLVQYCYSKGTYEKGIETGSTVLGVLIERFFDYRNDEEMSMQLPRIAREYKLLPETRIAAFPQV